MWLLMVDICGSTQMKRYFSIAVVLTLLDAWYPAAAADLSIAVPLKSPTGPYDASAPYNWNGFYAGGNFGVVWGRSNFTAGPGISGSTDLFQTINTFDEEGSFMAGMQGGYNYVLPSRILLGAEVDASFPSFQNLPTGVNPFGLSTGGTSNFTSPTLGAVSFAETVLASGTVRGRIGYAPGHWLFYATGGFAWTFDRQSLTEVSTGNSETPFLWRLGLGGRGRCRGADRAALDGAARISVRRLRHNQQNVLRNAAIQFRLPAPRGALRLELPVRQ
jgi:high affinity Mn2+ porin